MDLASLKKYYKNESSLVDGGGSIDFESYMYFELEDNKASFLYYPTLVGIKITDKCNMKCEFCFSENNIKGDLTITRFTEMANNLFKYKPSKIYLTGGEPFLNTDIIEIVKLIKSHNIRLAIHTNATLIDNEIALKLSSYLNENDYIQISLDGHTKDLYKLTRCNDKFEYVIRGIEFLKKYNIKLKVNTVVSNKNITNLVDIYEFACELGINEISFSPMLSISNGDCYLPLDEDILKSFSLVLNKYYKNTNTTKIVQDPIAVPWGNKILKDIFKDFDFVCPAARTAIEIDSRGNIYPCPYLHNNDFNMGNLFQDEYINIWNSNKTSQFREPNDNSDIFCNKCSNYLKCKCGCIANRYHSCKKFDSRCDKIRSMKNGD